MINLMPTEAKKNILYARRNASLFKWTIGCLIIIAAMAATVVLGEFYIDNAKHSLTKSIASTKQTIKDQKLDKVQAQAQDLSDGVKVIVQVLSKEVLFSKLLQQIGNLMPDGATLGDVQLSNTVNGAINLTANAVDYQAATQVQVNLEDPKNNLFSKVDTQSVTCSDSSQTTTGIVSKYKCQILVRALFKDNASVTFLANPPGSNK